MSYYATHGLSSKAYKQKKEELLTNLHTLLKIAPLLLDCF